MTLFRLRSLSILAVAVFGAACDDDIFGPRPAGMPYSAARLECIGPLSESGVAIYLATTPVHSLNPSAPYVRIVIWQPLAGPIEETWVIGGTGAQAGAGYYSTGTNYELATSGEITIDDVDSDNTIEGWADVTFPTAGRVGGNFRAHWISNNPMCI